MAGAGVPIRLDVRSLIKANEDLARHLERLLDDPEELLDEVGELLESSAQERFEEKRDPEGKPWKPWRDERYRERQTAKGASLLSESGGLRQSITHQADDDDVVVGTPDVRAATLFYGDTRLAWGRVTATWPARQALGISADDRAEIGETVEQFVAGAGGQVLS